jgi:hypothetical protein
MINCEICNKKTLIIINCKCGKKTCIECRNPRHECNYDFKNDAKIKLAKENVKVVADKIIKIN